MDAVLELQHLSKAFGAVQALSDVSVQLFPGEVLALVGDNGAGKSTLVRCLSGIHAPDGGSVLLDGKPIHLRHPADARTHGIETVHQELALCDNLDVVANLFLGRELRTRGFLDERAMEQRTLEVLHELSINIPDVRAEVGALSGGQRQCVAVARAVAWQPRVLLLDEPTAALGVAQTAQVLDLVVKLKSRGLAVVLISHNMADVFKVATRIMVLRLGRCVALHTRDDVDAGQVVADITGARGSAA